MTAKVWHIQPRRLGMLNEDVADRGRSAQRPEGHLHPHEQVPRRRVWRPAIAKVASHHLGDSQQERQCEGYPGLWTDDPQRSGAPIDILQLQTDDFAGTE